MLFRFIPCLSQSLLNYDDRLLIKWTNEYKLHWKDFIYSNDKPVLNRHYSEAISATNIVAFHRLDNSDIEFKIYATFDSDNSFTSDTSKISLLLHEQLHFDITEFHARLLRKAIDSIKAQRTISLEDFYFQLDSIHQCNTSMQILYDEQTAHGMINSAQEIWLRTIRNSLEKLSDFEYLVEESYNQ